MPKDKRTIWWKMYNHQRAIFDAIPDDAAGQALRMAFRYFDGEDVDSSEMSPLAWIAFSSMKENIDEAIEYVSEISEKNRKNVMKRWHPEEYTSEYGGIPPYTSEYESYQTIQTDTEEDKEEDRERDIETEKDNNHLYTNTAAIIAEAKTEGGSEDREDDTYDYRKATPEEIERKKQAQRELLAQAGFNYEGGFIL